MQNRPSNAVVDHELVDEDFRARIEEHISALRSSDNAFLISSLVVMRQNQIDAKRGLDMIAGAESNFETEQKFRPRLVQQWVSSTLYADAIEQEIARRQAGLDMHGKPVN